MTEDFNTLEEYSKCILECLNNILHDYQIAKDEKPLVIYATPSIAYAKMQERFANGMNDGPLITFYQSGIEIDKSVQMGGWKIMPVKRSEGNYLMRAPIICKINYTVTINALTEIEADMLQVQIMQATPFHRPYYTKLNGQFVTIVSDDPKNLSTVDAGDDKDKTTKRELILTIQRAYINYDIKELNAGKIIATDDSSDDSSDDLKVIKTYPNGAMLMEDGSIRGGYIEKNTSANGYAPFNYNIIDKDGNVIDVGTKGKVKITMNSIEGVKS